MCASVSEPNSTPLIDTDIRRLNRSPTRAGCSSSGVTSQGPIVVAKSLPLAGPSPLRISRRWMSRADQSLTTRYPAMWSPARSGVRSRPSRPTTTPTSSSKSSACESGGAATGSPEPTIACGLPNRNVGVAYHAAISAAVSATIAEAPWTCSSKATKSRNVVARTGASSRTRSSDTVSASAGGVTRATAAAIRSVPAGNSRRASPGPTAATRSRPSTSTRAYLTCSDLQRLGDDPLALFQDWNRLYEGVLLEVRVGPVLLQRLLVVVHLEDLEDVRLLRVLVDDVELAPWLLAGLRRQRGEGFPDDVLLARLYGPGRGDDVRHFSVLLIRRWVGGGDFSTGW